MKDSKDAGGVANGDLDMRLLAQHRTVIEIGPLPERATHSLNIHRIPVEAIADHFAIERPLLEISISSFIRWEYLALL